MKLNKLQKQAVNQWDGKSIISIYPNGTIQIQEFSINQQQSHAAESCECAMKKLDDLNVPRIDSSCGKEFSLIGRISWLQKNTAKIIEMV